METVFYKFLKTQIKYPQKTNYKVSFPPLPKQLFQIIYIDPPWHYGGKLQHEGQKGNYAGGCLNHYQSVPTHELVKLPVPDVADENCLMFMWATNPHLNQAILLGQAWGFNYSTVAFVWDKQMHNPGRYTISQCELCLLFKKGKIPTPRGRRNVRQLFSEKRSNHSTKPDTIRNSILEMFPYQKKIELFARKKETGWTAWGAEIGKEKKEKASRDKRS